MNYTFPCGCVVHSSAIVEACEGDCGIHELETLALRSENARLRALLDAEKREADALRSERDDRRKSLAQEIRQTLSTRGLHAPKDDRPESDLIGAVGMALDGLRALLAERTALLRECSISRECLIAYVIDIAGGEVPKKTHDLSRRIRAALED